MGDEWRPGDIIWPVLTLGMNCVVSLLVFLTDPSAIFEGTEIAHRLI